MINIKSPKNYNEMLGALNKATFFSTLLFLIGLRYLGVIPNIIIDDALIPPIKDYKEIIGWCLSFGVIPLVASAIAYLASLALEMHNILSKLLQIRYLWDKYYIVKPLVKRSGCNIAITRGVVRTTMNDLFYPSVKQIDQHYVELFWRYALSFWVLFEHCVIILVTIAVLCIYSASEIKNGLWVYLLSVVGLAFVQFIFVVASKSTDQANQIPLQDIKLFFKD